MVIGHWGAVLRHVQRLFQGEGLSGLTEGQLLERFASNRDEQAFGGILARHGPMVLGVCRGVLDDPHDVDDAFQATFLILVRKAGALRDAEGLGPWLYGVARKVALRARSASNRRKARERPEVEAISDPHATLDADLRELQGLIREEVDRLPGNDRMAVVLCYLEGLTHEEAADRLGWPVGTVKGRLSRAREKLKGRLTRRGVALPAAAIASTLARGAKAAVPLELIRSTVLAASQLAGGKALTAGIVSAQAMALMEGAIGTMFTTKLKVGAAALLASCVVGVPGVLAYQGAGPAGGVAPASQKVAPNSIESFPTKGTAGGRLPVPEGPGLDADRAEEVRLAEQALNQLDRLVAAGETNSASAAHSLWSRRLVEAQVGPDVPEPARKAALKAYVDRMQKLAVQAKQLADSGNLASIEVLDAQFRLIEAKRWLREGKISTVRAETPSIDALTWADDDRGRPSPKPKTFGDKQTEAILAKLEEPIPMDFGPDTTLEEVKKYIQEATKDPALGLPKGIPIYVDPVGLQAADKTMANTVRIELFGIPLKTTLRLLLKQLSLVYKVKDGLMTITSEDELPPAPATDLRGKPTGPNGNFR